MLADETSLELDPRKMIHIVDIFENTTKTPEKNTQISVGKKKSDGKITFQISKSQNHHGVATDNNI